MSIFFRWVEATNQNSLLGAGFETFIFVWITPDCWKKNMMNDLRSIFFKMGFRLPAN